MKHKRISSNKLASNLISVEKNRQPDMTELMLNDIDQYGESLTNNCTFRLSALTGQYFVTGKTDRNPWGTVQLAWASKVRLCKLTGGKSLPKPLTVRLQKC